jgi:hypothetical protein
MSENPAEQEAWKIKCTGALDALKKQYPTKLHWPEDWT